MRFFGDFQENSKFNIRETNTVKLHSGKGSKEVTTMEK